MQILELKRKVVRLGVLLTTGGTAFGVTALGLNIALDRASAASPLPVASATSTSSASVPEVPIGSVRDVTGWKDITFPVDSYKVTATARNLILDAEYQATKTCMARYGLTFTAPSWTKPAADTDYVRFFGIVDRAAAQQYGYHTGEAVFASGETASQTSTDPNATTPNYLTVFTGDPAGAVVNGVTVPSGGCISEARAALGDTSAGESLVEDALAYGLTQSDGDPRVTSRFASWSSCMAKAGFDYATPMAANRDSRWATSAASSAEKSVATADVDCKMQTGLTGLRLAVASAWQTKFITSRAAQFAALKADLAAQTARADAVLH